jgi:putative flippase GtrA
MFPKTFAAYGAVSVLTLCVELSILHTALAVGLVSPIAVSCGYLTASLFQFCVLRYIVFKAAHRPVFMQVNAYVIAAIVSWWTVLGAVSLLIALFHISTMEARVVSIPALFPLNYLVSKYFVFKK